MRPIETIKVGDYVLSKSESNVSQPEYQRVTCTHNHDEKEVYFLNYGVGSPDGPLAERVFECVVATGDHQFWLKRMIDQATGEVNELNAWISVHSLCAQAMARITGEAKEPMLAELELKDGRPAYLDWQFPILRTSDPNVGLVFTGDEYWADGYEGVAIRFTPSGPAVTIKASGAFEEMVMDLDEDSVDDLSPDSVTCRTGGFQPLRRKVYDIDVAANNTYYVGTAGVLVRDATQSKT